MSDFTFGHPLERLSQLQNIKDPKDHEARYVSDHNEVYVFTKGIGWETLKDHVDRENKPVSKRKEAQNKNFQMAGEFPTFQALAVQQAVKVLNRFLEIDPVAANKMFLNSAVPVKPELLEDPSIMVHTHREEGKPEVWLLRPLGLINGLFGTRRDGRGFIRAHFNPELKVIEKFSADFED